VPEKNPEEKKRGVPSEEEGKKALPYGGRGLRKQEVPLRVKSIEKKRGRKKKKNS